MNEWIHVKNHEHTSFESEDFQFSCFYIESSNTLPHWHAHSEIIFIGSGSCTVYVDGTLFSCQKGDFVFVPPNRLHSISVEAGSIHYALVIGDTLLKQMMTDKHCTEILAPFIAGSGSAPFAVQSGQEGHEHCLIHLKNMIREQAGRENGFQLAIKLELCSFFLMLAKHFPDLHDGQIPGTEKNARVLIRTLEYIKKNYVQRLTITNTSRYLNMSAQHFCRTFKAYTGKTFVEYLTLFRLEKANQLLCDTDLPITQIPELTGFCNANYFARVYKHHYGYPPSHTRKMKCESMVLLHGMRR